MVVIRLALVTALVVGLGIGLWASTATSQDPGSVPPDENLLALACQYVQPIVNQQWHMRSCRRAAPDEIPFANRVDVFVRLAISGFPTPLVLRVRMQRSLWTVQSINER